MATVEIKLLTVQTRALTGSTMPVAGSVPVAEAVATLSDSSQAVEVAASADADRASSQIWEVKAIGAAARVIFGDSPTVTQSTGWHVSDGERLQFGVSAPGESPAVIAAD